MAVYYWDYGADATSSTTATATVTVTSGTSTSTSYYHDLPSSTSTWYTRPRSIIVHCPETWDKGIIAAYVKLVNDDTHTGWKITMLIDGSIAIVDPSIDVRSMKDFILLLNQYASPEDKVRIDAFFADYGNE